MPSGSTSLWQPFSIPLDGSGDGSQEVGAPSLGYNWSGWVVMGAATAGQKVSVQVAGQVVAWGSSQTGPFAAGSGQTVTVTVTGGTPNSQLSGVLQGAVNVGNLPELPPGAGSGTLVDIASGTVTVDAANVTIVGGQGGGINVSTETPPQPLGQVVSSGSFESSLEVSPPAGATGLRVLVYQAPASSYELTEVGGIGSVSGTEMFSTGSLNLKKGAVFDAPLSGDFESITVSLSFSGSPAAGTVLGEVFALFASEVSTPQNIPDNPLYVQGGNAESVAPNADAVIIGQGGVYYRSLGVGLTNSDVVATGQQGATGFSVQTVREAPSNNQIINSSIASGGSSELIAGVSGKSIRVRRLQFNLNAAEQVIFATAASGGTNLFVSPGVSGYNSPDLDFEGWSLPAGDSLYVNNVGTGTVIVIGRITYDQY